MLFIFNSTLIAIIVKHLKLKKLNFGKSKIQFSYFENESNKIYLIKNNILCKQHSKITT